MAGISHKPGQEAGSEEIAGALVKFASKEGEIENRRCYFPASISSISFLSSVFTSELSDTLCAKARLER